MADETGSVSAFDALFRTMSLTLDPRGGRVFAHHAKPSRPDHQIIELKCHYSGDDDHLFNSGVIIGTDKHAFQTFWSDDDEDERDGENPKPPREEEGWRLGSIPIMLSIYEVDEDWMAESAAKHGGNPLVGQFSYQEMINTSDGVVDDKWPSCTAWIGVGRDTFCMLRDRILDFRMYDFKVGIEVRFPAGQVETGWMGRTVKWDGKSDLEVVSAVVVWQKEDWRRDVKRRLMPKRPQEDDYVAPREHSEALQATNRIETAVSKLATPVNRRGILTPDRRSTLTPLNVSMGRA